MPLKQNLMPPIDCRNADFLESALAIYQVRGAITRNQAIAVRQVCRLELPAIVALDQRTPKGVIYVSVNGQPHSEVNTRAKTYRVNT
jgi:hypothetical protein